MIDPQQLSAWIVVVFFFVVCALLYSFRPDSINLSDLWERLSSWAAKHEKPDLDDEDQIAVAELREVLREERRRADIERLRHLVATDTYMSATRQLANRMAYQRLLYEAEQERKKATVPSYVAATPDRWVRTSSHTTRESLDIDWR